MGKKSNNKPPSIKTTEDCLQAKPLMINISNNESNSIKMTFFFKYLLAAFVQDWCRAEQKFRFHRFWFFIWKNKSHELNIVCCLNEKLMHEHAMKSLPLSQPAGYWFGNVWNLQRRQAQVRGKKWFVGFFLRPYLEHINPQLTLHVSMSPHYIASFYECQLMLRISQNQGFFSQRMRTILKLKFCF